MHLLVYTGQVSGCLNDKNFSRVGVLYNLKQSLFAPLCWYVTELSYLTYLSNVAHLDTLEIMVNFSCILASILTANSYISLLQLKSTHKMFFFILYYAFGSIWLHYFQYEFQVHSIILGREKRMKRNSFVVDFTWSKEIKKLMYMQN